MLQKPTAISVRANKEYIQLLKVLAMRRNIAVADLVRQALDAQYSTELEQLPPFFAPSGNL